MCPEMQCQVTTISTAEMLESASAAKCLLHILGVLQNSQNFTSARLPVKGM